MGVIHCMRQRGPSPPQVTEVVRALMEAGADASAQDKDGRNPLHAAARVLVLTSHGGCTSAYGSGRRCVGPGQGWAQSIACGGGVLVLTSHGGRTSAYGSGRRCVGPGQGWAQSVA
jgi:hypothetical protein